MQPHKLFLITSLAVSATAGTTLGLWMALGWAGLVPPGDFALHLSAHAQLQVYGFVALFTMGVAMMVLPGFLRTELQPRWLAYLSLALMVAGIGLNLTGPTLPGGVSQSLATLAFLFVLRITRHSAPPAKRESSPLSRGHSVFLAAGSLWLMACPILALWESTRALETVLWGFAAQYIAGIGLRVHPGILGIKGVKGELLMPAAFTWNAGLVLLWTGPPPVWPWVIGLAVGLFLMALRPFRRPFIPPAGGAWLRYFVRVSYLWLACAVVLACLTETGRPELAGATRHMLASGFILTMMVGMGMRMIPAFENKRLVWAHGPWVVFWLLTVGTVLRVPAQAVAHLPLLAAGGALQFLAVITFAGLLTATYLFGGPVYESVAAHQFKNERHPSLQVV